MGGHEIPTAKAFAVGAPHILALVLALFGLSYHAATLSGLPSNLGLPTAVNVLGAVVALSGPAVITWTLRNRSPATVIVSTYVTLTKAIRRTPPDKTAGRTEPLVITGPQQYTRNPLYFGIFMTVLGWALLTASSYMCIAAGVFLGWFTLVMIPFEERELRALFGAEWTRYCEETPMFVPLTKRKKHKGSIQLID